MSSHTMVPKLWPKSYTPPKYPDESNWRKRKGMQGPELAAWRNGVRIERAREILGLAFDEFDELTDPIWYLEEPIWNDYWFIDEPIPTRTEFDVDKPTNNWDWVKWE